MKHFHSQFTIQNWITNMKSVHIIRLNEWMNKRLNEIEKVKKNWMQTITKRCRHDFSCDRECDDCAIFFSSSSSSLKCDLMFWVWSRRNGMKHNELIIFSLTLNITTKERQTIFAISFVSIVLIFGWNGSYGTNIYSILIYVLK